MIFQAKRRSFRVRLTLLIAIMLLIVTACTDSATNKEVAPETVKLKDDPHAIVYYSTDLPHERIGDGLSYLFLIDKQGKYTKIKKRGLELNSVIPLGQSLLLNQKEQMLTIQADNNIQTTPYKEDCKVPAGYGQSSGKLNGGKTYYSIFNGRFSDDMKYYISKVRWGDETKHYCKDIREFVEATGNDGKHIYYISSDVEDPSKKFFHKASIQGDQLKFDSKTLLEKSTEEGRFMFTKLIAVGDDMVGVYADLIGNKVELNLMQVAKDNKTPFKKHPLLQYDGSNTKYYFFNKESIYLKDGQVYFVDGYGDVYTYNLETKKLNKKFHLNDYQRDEKLQDEIVYFHNDHLYFYHFHEKSKSHQIETYNLEGKVVNTLKLPDLKKEIGRDSVYLYDFKILHH
ncbi:hypothetical protein [Paenibacillus assamensis]|uniref:hypothetical protein n=1 Tax=Paenibacillus assamensis TaxID=311244 RepID=UPI0003F8A0BF|nr:hypothetical protein [Paenibacillus assamensis]